MEKMAALTRTESGVIRLRSLTNAGLFLLVNSLLPVAVRLERITSWYERVIRLMKQSGNSFLSFVTGILLTVRQMAHMKRAIYVLLFLIVAILLPVLIWLALAVALRDLALAWRESHLASVSVCYFNNDCPRGYVCIAGRCVPLY